MAVDNPALRLCAGCRLTVATGQPRSRDYCGPCYRSEVLSKVELVRCQVVGLFPVVNARTGEDVTAPGYVELDPEHTHIPLLIAGGHVKLAEPAPAKSKG